MISSLLTALMMVAPASLSAPAPDLTVVELSTRIAWCPLNDVVDGDSRAFAANWITDRRVLGSTLGTGADFVFLSEANTPTSDIDLPVPGGGTHRFPVAAVATPTGFVATDTLAGGPGAAYVYEWRLGDEVELTQTLHRPTTQGVEGFGISVDVHDDWLAIGDFASFESGRVELYRLIDGTWEHAQSLSAPGLGPDARFGRAVHFVGDQLLVTAPWNIEGFGGDGQIQVFDHIDGSWVWRQSIGGDVAPNNDIGDAIDSLSDSIAVATDTSISGFVMIRRADSGDWSIQSGVSVGTVPGSPRSLAVSDEHIVLGLGTYDPHNEEAFSPGAVGTVRIDELLGQTEPIVQLSMWPGGAISYGRGIDTREDGTIAAAGGAFGDVSTEALVHVFHPCQCNPCTTDVDANGTTDFDDLVATVASFGAYNPRLDHDRDRQIGFGDLLAVLDSWGNCE